MVMDQPLQTTTDVLDALGGSAAVAEMMGLANNAVSNWKKRETFPPKTHLVLMRELKARGLNAPDSLWGMLEGVNG